jgi:hypothetical protein
MRCQADLPYVVRALNARRRFANPSGCRQYQREDPADNDKHNEQFQPSESLSRRLLVLHGLFPGGYRCFW